MTTPATVTISELLARLRAGELAGDGPCVVVELDAADTPVAAAQRLERHELRGRLAQAPVVLIGIARSAPAIGSPAADAPVFESATFDLLLCEDPEAPSPWIACDGGLDQTLDEILATIGRSPDAAQALVQLLRVGETLTVADAVVAESWTYSLLQGGDRHRAWLAARADRVRSPRPERDVVLLERIDDVLTITLDRAEVRNAYGIRMRDELVEALEFVALDATIERVELRGNGPAFSSGGDLDEFGTAPAPFAAHLVRTSRNAGLSLARVADRVTAHVHGTCVGAGVELPAFAAEVVAHPDTTFLLPEIGMGLVPGAGGTASIPRRIGRHRTTFLALTGRPLDAVTALAWGLVDRVDDEPFPNRGEHR